MSLLKALRRALDDPAATPERQVERLREIGTYPSADEFALEFDDCAQVAKQLVDRGEITEATRDAILRLNHRLTEFGGSENAAEWDASALAISRNWDDVRQQAQNILRAMAAD